MLNLLRLSFLPQSSNLGLLVLRVSLGLTMILFHGWDKIIKFSEKLPAFDGLLGLPAKVNLSLAIFAEVGCSSLLIIGLFTRFAALNLSITMAVAFFIKHGAEFTGPKSGELAFVYMIGFITLLFAGGGKFSLDGK